MGLFLKQSTAATVQIGPFVDSTDGNTEEGALTISQADVRLSKNGANIAQKNEATSCTYDEVGMYSCPLDATDTNTLGRLQLIVHEAGSLPVYHEFMVLPANTYDSLVSGSDYIDAQVRGLDDIDLSATMKASVNTEVDNALNTAIPGAPTANSINERVATMDDAYTATRAGYLDELAAANLPTDITTILADTNELQTDWANGGRLDLLIDAIKAKTDLLVIADIVDAVWDETMSAHSTGDSAGLAQDNILKILKNKWAYSGTSFIIYDDDGATPLYSFTLDSATAPTSRTPV